jgi:hypothetical protein
MESVLKEILQKQEKSRLDLQIAAEAAQEARIREAAVKAAKNPKNATTNRKLSAPQSTIGRRGEEAEWWQALLGCK